MVVRVAISEDDWVGGNEAGRGGEHGLALVQIGRSRDMNVVGGKYTCWAEHRLVKQKKRVETYGLLTL